VDEARAVNVELEPGQISLHHVRTVHGSLPNRGRERRIGFSIQPFIPTYVRQTRGEDAAMLVRGEDRYRHFRLARRPMRDMDPEDVAFRRRVREEVAEILYEGAAERRSFN